MIASSQPAIFPAFCLDSEDVLGLTRKRFYKWHLPGHSIEPSPYVKKHHIWQNLVNNKLIGSIFAAAHGVHAPRVLGCFPGGATKLPAKWPDSWGDHFVIKPLDGSSSKGVLLLDRTKGLAANQSNYVDRLSQKTKTLAKSSINGRLDFQRHYQRSGLSVLLPGLLIVEELVCALSPPGCRSVRENTQKRSEPVA